MAEYIERTALLKWGLDSMDAQRDVVGKAYCAEFLRAARQFKAADVAPVVHGCWIWNAERTRPHCSECADVPWRADNTHLPNFCPNCGAKMEEEETDNE